MNKLHLYILASLLTSIGLGMFAYKVLVLNYPLSADQVSTVWSVEVGVSFDGSPDPVKVSLFIPSSQEGFSIIDENFISHDFGLSTSTKEGNRQASWSSRTAPGRQQLFYRALVRSREQPGEPVLLADNQVPTVQIRSGEVAKGEAVAWEGSKLVAARAIIDRSKQRSADLDTLVLGVLTEIFSQTPSDDVNLLLGKPKKRKNSQPTAGDDELKRIQLAVHILDLAGIRARVVHGVRLERQMRNTPWRTWLEVAEGGGWTAYEPTAPQRGVPREYLAWWRGEGGVLNLKGIERAKVAVSTDSRDESLLSAALMPSNEGDTLIGDFSLFSLPLHTQLVYRILMLVPLGALAIVLLRNVVGIKTFGTFMPVLIAMAFRETQLIAGLILFISIVAAGLIVRFYLEHLKLLLVPRLAAVLVVVILLMALASILGHKLGFEHWLSAALFPMVILTMTVERMSIVWEELGATASIRQGVGTLFAASIVYFIITWRSLDHLFFVFPELVLVVLAVILLLGRYTGYRVTELLRFRNIQSEHV